MIPSYIRTHADLSSIVTVGATTESLFLDFKATLDTRQDGWQLEAGQDVSQFANTLGGCLLLGVGEQKDPNTGLKVASAMRGVQEPDRVRGWVETAIVNTVVPSTISHTIDMIPASTGVVVAVNVVPSRRLVYVWQRSDGTVRCTYRTNHGKAWMNPDEMERHMMNGSRAARLAFIEACAGAPTGKSVTILGGLWEYRSNNLHHRQAVFEGTLSEQAIGDCFEVTGSLALSSEVRRLSVKVPFDLLRSVWIESDGKIAVLLAVRLLLVDGRHLTLEPYC
jgi:hypothetical protein